MGFDYKKKGEDEDNGFDVGFKVPDTKSLLEKLTTSINTKEQIAKEHQEENEKQGKNKKPKQKRGGLVCFCEDPSCGIGPMVEKQGE